MKPSKRKLKPDKYVKNYTILGHKYIALMFKCQGCNRYFKDLNLHDAMSRCGRHRKGKLLKFDKEYIEKVGLDIAIKKRKP